MKCSESFTCHCTEFDFLTSTFLFPQLRQSNTGWEQFVSGPPLATDVLRGIWTNIMWAGVSSICHRKQTGTQQVRWCSWCHLFFILYWLLFKHSSQVTQGKWIFYEATSSDRITSCSLALSLLVFGSSSRRMCCSWWLDREREIENNSLIKMKLNSLHYYCVP